MASDATKTYDTGSLLLLFTHKCKMSLDSQDHNKVEKHKNDPYVLVFAI
jgi:hypothetical protein